MTPEEFAAALAAPFAADEVKWKPQAVKGDRALAICFIDARAVMDRLDEVAGVGGWKDEYAVLAEHNVMCRLSVLVGGEWVTKADVGGESEQPDGGDRAKAAFSDALKRAAVKFGVGRYLYSLPHQWCDYDAAKRKFSTTPKLPASALPKAKASGPRPAKESSAPAATAEHIGGPADAIHPPRIGAVMAEALEALCVDASTAPRTVCETYKVSSLADLTPAQAEFVGKRLRDKLTPASAPGATITKWVTAYSAKLVGEGLAMPDELEDSLVSTFGAKHGRMATWTDSVAADVQKACKQFEANARKFIRDAKPQTA